MTLIKKFVAALLASGLFIALEIAIVMPVYADETKPYISVGAARTKKTVIAMPDGVVKSERVKAQAKEIQQTLSNDLLFMDLFRFLGSDAFVEKAGAGLTPDSFKMSDWTSIGTEFLIKTGVTVENDNLVLEAYLYDVNAVRTLISKRYVAGMSEAKLVAHTFANQIVEIMTGLPGIFMTKIAAVCDRTGKKEIYTMNFDGSDVRQITHHYSITVGPAWSPDGTKIAYSLFTKRKNNVKNLDLYEFDFLSESVRLLSNRSGLNTGPAYSPDGKKIAVTMSFLGNPDIFSLDPATKVVERLTKSFGEDVDPAWAPDGKKIAFVSSRTGMPMVYGMNADGSNVQRLTFAGKYNATPSWSPTNNKIAFAGWIDGRVDIFLMNPDGTTIERLTKNQGKNEDPHFSPDGNFVVFSSDRTGQKNIYAMNVDGTFVKRLTFGLGNCVSPKWAGLSKKR